VRALAALLVVLVAAPASAGGLVGRSDACRWRVVRDARGPDLWAVTARPGELWAVGDDGSHPAILRRQAGIWRTSASPFFALDVDASSARDVWAVGSSSPGGELTRPRAAHWDGARWRAAPVAGRPATYLRAVATLSSRDAWAVGADVRGPLVEHWNGTRWSRSAAGPEDGLLHGVDALSPQAIWAVGTQGMQTLGPQSENPLVERLEGGRWQPLSSPILEWVDANLLAVDAVSADDVWAVGSADTQGGRAPLVERWDGRAWNVASTSGLPQARAALSAVAASAPEDVWAAGWRGFASAQRALLAHWDGRRWSLVPGPPGAFNDLAALSSRDIWAVGGIVAGRASRSLIAHYSCASTA